jgi:tetratricopeptide (TPR) repeat protein
MGSSPFAEKTDSSEILRYSRAVRKAAFAVAWMTIHATASAAPLRVCVASFAESKPSWRGAVVADELADRLALVPSFAVTDREHVREAETALGLAGTDDPQKLLALGKRLQADLVVGGLLDKQAKAILVEPSKGGVEEMSVAGGRPDRAAGALAKALLDKRKVEVPALARSAIEGADGADKPYESYGQGRELLFGQKNAAAALPLLEAAVAGDATLARAHATLSRAHLLMKDNPAAAKEAQAAVDKGAALREVRLEAARVEDFADRIDSAVDKYKATLEVSPNDAIAHSNLGRLLFFKKHEPPAGGKEMDAALEAEPGWEAARYNAGLMRLQLGRVTDALAVLERLHQDVPNDPRYAVRTAVAYRMAGRPAMAEKTARQALDGAPKNVEARAELSQDLAELGRSDDALKLIDEAADADKSGARLRTARGRVLYKKGDLDGAIQAFEAGRGELGKAPQRERRDLLVSLAVARLGKHDAPAALRDLEAVVDEDPRDGEAQYDLGLAAQAAGDKAKALAALGKAAELMPQAPAPAIALGNLQLDGDPAAAAKTYKSALDGGSEDPRLRLGLGLALWRQGQLTPAVEELRRAADAHPPADVEAEARYDLAEALLAAGKRADAKAAATRYLELEKRTGPSYDARITRAKQLAK